jgi:N-acetylneuraminate synthase
MTDFWTALNLPPDRVTVVAELSNAHNGDLERALRILAAAQTAGADAVKFQAYTPGELIGLRGDGTPPPPWDTMTMYDLYAKAETPREWFPELVGYCATLGLPWFASVFGPGSLAVMEMLHCPVYKVAALDYRSRKWLDTVRMTGKPIIRSVPLAQPPSRMLPNELALYCPPGYPQTAVEYRLMRRFDGFSSHGTDPLVPIFAVYEGARIVEVHVHLEDEPSALEANVCLSMPALRQLTVYAHAQ